MTTYTRLAVLFGLGLAIVACSAGGGGTIDDPANQTPQTEAQVTSPSSSLQVTASISAATLGDECANTRSSGDGFAAGDCAPEPADAGAGGAGRCGGGGGCQRSNMQLAFAAGAQGQAAKIEIVEVTFHDEAGTLLGSLTPSAPKSWTGSSYAPWNETIAPSSSVKASYELTSPEWSKLGSGSRSYSAKYRLRVSLRIDGASILLESTVLNREPAVAT